MRAVVAVLMAAALVVSAVHASLDSGSDEGEGEGSDRHNTDAESETGDSVELVTAHGTKVVELGSSAVRDEHVYEFHQIVGGSLPVLVEFYLPSCGHCQGFAPEYERVAHAFSDEPVVIARVDANRWTSVADHYHVKSVPDIRFFPALSKQDALYTRARVASDLVEYINEYTGTKVAFDYNFKQKLSGAAESTAAAAAVVDAGTCPVLRNGVPVSFVEIEGESDAELDAEDKDYEGELSDDENEHETEEEAVEHDIAELEGESEETDAAEQQQQEDVEVDDANKEAEQAQLQADVEDELNDENGVVINADDNAF